VRVSSDQAQAVELLKARPEFADKQAQGGFEPEVPLVFDPAIFDRQPVEEFTVALFFPAQVQRKAGDLDRFRKDERKRQIRRQQLAELVDTQSVHDVFDASNFSVGAIAVAGRGARW
jgi:hypothetical protein